LLKAKQKSWGFTPCFFNQEFNQESTKEDCSSYPPCPSFSHQSRRP